jgi:two-component system, chemotaxis family, protein-glutamate methylesterase/glutaminase
VEHAARDLVVVGASAGGVEALRALVAGLPADFPASLLVVLHMPAGGTSALPAILERAGPVPAAAAVDGQPLIRGEIRTARPNHHLLVLDGRTRLVHGPTENGHRPAIDALFRSAARDQGTKVIGVLLSGVLDDGAAGLSAIAARGGLTIVQDPADALYPSMPASALRHLQPDHVLPAGQIGTVLAKRVAEQAILENVPEPSRLVVFESEITVNGERRHAAPGVEDMAEATGLSCPDCNGTLFHLADGVSRYRCRVGHAWTAEALLQEQSGMLERALWTALRTLDEKASLAERMQIDARQRGAMLTAERYADAAAEATQAAEVLRTFLFGPAASVAAADIREHE